MGPFVGEEGLWGPERVVFGCVVRLSTGDVGWGSANNLLLYLKKIET